MRSDRLDSVGVVRLCYVPGDLQRRSQCFRSSPFICALIDAVVAGASQTVLRCCPAWYWCIIWKKVIRRHRDSLPAAVIDATSDCPLLPPRHPGAARCGRAPDCPLSLSAWYWCIIWRSQTRVAVKVLSLENQLTSSVRARTQQLTLALVCIVNSQTRVITTLYILFHILTLIVRSSHCIIAVVFDSV